MLLADSNKGVFLLDVICGILVGNLRHIGEQYASFYTPICVILGTNMPHIDIQSVGL